MKQLIVLILITCVLAGCANTLPLAPTHLLAQTDIVQPGDQVRVVVFGEENLSGLYNVDSHGSITLPLTGDIKLAGLTLNQSAAAIVAHFKEGFLHDPQVAVSIEHQRDVYILGEVQRPGNYSYTPNLTVIQAVAKAGGYSYRADHNDIILRRADAKQPALSPKFSATEDTPLLPGDSLTIRERYF